MMTIINDTADRMPNATWEIGQKQVDNLKLLPSAYNWDHNRVASNHVSLLKLSPVTALNPVAGGFGCRLTPSVVASHVPNLTLTVDVNQANVKMGLQAVS
jgi:hypothetical protein